MKTWCERPTEIAYGFNPAYCGWLLREAVEEYTSVKPGGMPFAMVFLVLPVLLHRHTRESLPKSTATALHPWLQDHPEARVNFAERARAFVQITREAILFLARHRKVVLGEDANLTSAGQLERGKSHLTGQSEGVKTCVRKARLVGKWFAEAGEAATVLHMWGVRP